MDIRYTPSTANDVTDRIKATPEWVAAKALALKRLSDGADEQAIALEVAGVLRPEWDIEELVGELFAGGFAGLDDPEARERLYLGFSLFALASVLGDIEGTNLPLLPMMTGGVQVEVHEQDGVRFPVVIAMASPFTPPTIVEEFRKAYEQTFPNPIKESANARRDSEWVNRHSQGESYRDIALTDPRSGLAPEAAIAPDEYPDEVLAASDKVAKACQRYITKWTKVVEPLSKEADE